ncbi:MAG: TonB-dependent receptor, partial [Sphingomonadaceae bacterium]
MRKTVWMLSAGMMAIATPAFAQETDTDDGGAEPTQGATAEAAAVDDSTVEQDLDDQDTSAIVITATRRNEALSDVPLAVSAVTAEQLKNTGADDIRALTQVSPSLLVSSTSSEAAGGVARIRGVGTVGDNPGLESSVAVFIDGVYRSRTGVGLTELGAIERIEVLRGPQGTLFGRNASAGLISIITAKPRFDTEVAGAITLGNYDYRRFDLSATGGLSDTVAARIDGVYVQRDGFLEDVISGRTVNDRDRWLVRGQLLFEPTSDLSIRLIGDYAKRDEECCGATYLPAVDYTQAGESPSSIAALQRALGAVVNDDTFTREIAITPGRGYNSDVEDWGVSGEIVYDFGGVELTSISAYRFNEYVRGQDAHYNNLDILYRPGDGSGFTEFKTFTQEVRLQGTALDERLDWLVGGYFAKEDLTLRDNLAYGDDYLRYANCLALASSLPLALAPTTDPNGNCTNAAALGGAQAQVNAGVAQLQAGIAQLDAAIAQVQAALALDPTNVALQQQLAALQAQRAGFAAQLAALLPQAALLNTLNADPSNPVFGSAALAVGLGSIDPFAGVRLDDLFEQSSTNFALFTHNIFEITDRFDLTLGLRYTNESKSLDVSLADNNVFCRTISNSPLVAFDQLPCVIPATATGTLTGSSERDESEFSGTAVLSYELTDRLLGYLSYSRGYKAGGFNLDRSALARIGGDGALLPNQDFDTLQFEPEINNAFELGFKFDGRGLDINVAAFEQRFDDFQLNQFNGLFFEVENVNGCSDIGDPNADSDNVSGNGACVGDLEWGVRSRGVEFELFSRPIDNVQLNFGGTYVDTKYNEDLVGANGAPLGTSFFQLPGRRISNSNQFTITGSLAWTPPIGNSGLTGLFYVDGRHMSSFNTGSDLDLEKVQPAFQVVNGRVGIRGPDENWSIELWGQNLLNEDFIQVAFDAPIQGGGSRRGVDAGFDPVATRLYGAFLGEPRTYGITLRGKLSPPPKRMPEVAPPPPPPPP